MTTSPRSVYLSAALTILALGAPVADAQDDFESLALFELQPGATGIENSAFDFGDVNDDGRLDAVVQLPGASQFVTILQQPDGAFEAGPPVFVGEPDVVRLAHLDDDGMLDLVMVSNTVLPLNATLDIRLGNGDGTFTPTHVQGVDNGVVDLEIDDLDGDDVSDIVSLSEQTESFSVLLGNGDGSFAPAVDAPTGGSPKALALGDLDGDDVLDLIVARTTAGFSIWLGDGDGSFTAGGGVVTGGIPAEVQLGDLDGNGTLDAVVGRLDDDARITWAPGLGDGTFAAPIDLSLIGDGFSAVLRVADFDEDGDADLAFRYFIGVTVALNAGDGTFGEPQTYLAAGGDFQIRDANGDGDADLVAAYRSFEDTALAVLQGNGRGRFRPYMNVPGLVGFTRLADMDNDGRVDLVVLSNVDDVILMYPGQGAGFFGEPASFFIDKILHTTGALADFDGDGNQDFAALVGTFGNPAYEMSVWFGDGDFGFGSSVSLPIEGWVNDVLATDIDADGDVDIAAMRDASIRVMLNNGSGGFGSASNYLVGSNGPMLFGDYTGDQIGDIATIRLGSVESLRVLPGNGDGTFGALIEKITPVYTWRLASADFDEDGDLDLVVPYNSDRTRVHLNDGDGTFGTSVDLVVDGISEGVAVGDFDADGHADVAVASGSQVLLFAGDGLGGFDPPETYDILSVEDIYAQDADGDGVLDLLTQRSSIVQVILNRNGPWSDLGAPLAGEQGLPKLVGAGSLLPGDTFRQTLTDARPGSLTSWYLGISEWSLPFKGGVFVPAADLLVPVTTDPDGDWTFAFEWPAGLGGGYPLWFQVWLADPAGVFGFASSNGLRADVP